MRYSLRSGLLRKTQTKIFSIGLSFVLVLTGLSGAAALFFSQTAHAAASVYINEVMPNPSSGHEWVELYSPTTTDVHLKNWYIKDAAGHQTNFADGDKLNNGHHYITLSTNDLNNGGDTVTLYDNSHTAVNTLTYGDFTSNQGESFGRSPDGSSNLVTFTSDHVTKDSQNYVPSGTLTLTPTPPSTVTVGDTVSFTAHSSDFANPTYSVSSADPFISSADINPATGQFSWIPSITEVGTQTITIAAKDGGQTETATATIAVSPFIITIPASLTVSPETSVSGGPITLSATFEVLGGGAPLQSVSFSLNGTAVGSALTDSNGVATLTVTPSPAIPVGTHPGYITASATAFVFGPISGSADLTITPAPTPTAPAAPTLTGFSQDSKSLACGALTNTNGTSPNTTHMQWTGVSDVKQYEIAPTYPGGIAGSQYFKTGTDAWIGDNFSHRGDGTYSYVIRAQGTNGLWSAYSAPCTLTYDSTAPTVTVTPVAGSLLHGTETFDITIHDANPLSSQNASIWTYLYDTAGAQKSQGAKVDLSSGTGTFTVDTTKLDDGNANLDVAIVHDAAGNASGKSDNYFSNYTIDNTAPTGLANFSPADGTITTTAKLTQIDWTDATDAHSPVVYYYESSNSSATNPDGSFINPVYQSGVLASSQISATGTPAGTYYWHVRAVDALGNSTSWTSPWKITVDNTAPVVDITSPTNGQYVSTRETSWKLTATGSVTDSTFSYYYCWVSSGSTGKEVGTRASLCGTNYSQVSNGTLGVISDLTTSLPDGNYKFNVVARDKAGNVTTVSQPFVLDNTRPTISFVNPTDFSKPFQAGPNLQIVASDPGGSGIASTVLHIYNADNSPAKFCSVSSTDTTSCSASGLPDGDYYVKAGATDNAGNNETITQAFTVDSTAPDAPVLASPDNNAIVNGASITQSWSDTSSDVDHYIYESYSDAAATHLRWHEEFTTTSKTATNVAETTYWWRVKAVDKAGNESGWSDLWKITVDNTAPVVTITTPSDGDTVSGTVTITGTITDNNPDHYYLVVKDSHGKVVAGPNTVNQPVTSFSYNWDTTKLADGTYTIDLEARDAAQNKDDSSTQTITVTVDNGAPGVPTLEIPVSGSFLSDGHITFSWDASTDPGNISPVHYMAEASLDGLTGADGSFTNAIPGSAFTTADGQTSLPSTLTNDGAFYWHIKAVDTAGNQSDWSTTSSFTLDTVAPAVTITGYGQNGNVIQPSVTATDPAPGTALTYSWTTNPNVIISNTSALNPTFTVNHDGTYSFTLTVTDAAGNATSKVFGFTYTTPSPQPTTPPFTGVVAGANTTLPDNGTGTTTPEVLGDSTTTPNDVQPGDNISKDKNVSSSSNFLGLGWWWLLVLAVILGILWLILGTASKDDKKA